LESWPDVPHQQVRIEVPVAEVADPADAPRAERFDDIDEFFSAWRKRVCRAAIGLGAFYHPGADQRL
jgi:hypothetical protein